MDIRIATLPGDGIGPEVTQQAVHALTTVAEIYGHNFEFVELLIGGVAIKQTGSPFPRETRDQCLLSNAVLLGAVGAPEYDELKPSERPEAGLLAIRRALGGFANLRPVVCYEALADCSPIRPELVSGADILIVRELLGGLYFGEPRGFDATGASPGAFNTMRYTEAEVERVARVAFEAARKRRHKVTSVDKANVLETSQLWRRTVTRIAKDYPDVALDHGYVDSCAMHLIMRPTSFDVLLTENLFGDILSDEAAVLSGSLGTLASATIGGAIGLYEPVHGSAPDIAGKGLANPIGAIASAALLLRYSAGLEHEAHDLEEAIRTVLRLGYRTPDINRGEGTQLVSTAELGTLIVGAIAEIADRRFAYHAV
jgi:3-isopropylmalate dehydrogenase